MTILAKATEPKARAIDTRSINPEIFYTAADAAKLFNKSVAWFARHRWLGTGPTYRKGMTPVLYRGSDLLKWLEDRSSAKSAA